MSILPEKKVFSVEDIEALPDGERMELIDGEAYDMAPPSRFHQEIVAELLAAIIAHIKAENGGCKAYPSPFAVRLFNDDRNYVEPDISVICDKSKLTDKGCNGAPDWIIEVMSPGTWLHDMYRKLDLYRNAGVREYWIISPKEGTVIVHAFPDSREYTFDDDIPVSIWPEFSICISRLLR